MRGESRRGNIGAESKDQYYERRKYPEPTICPNCGLIYRQGHWTESSEKPAKANRELCPACRREKDHYPAGMVYIAGSYLTAKKEEIMNIARNCEKLAKAHRPLQRIMWVKKNNNSVEIATTSEHLARRIGQAINDAHGGELAIKYVQGDKFVRVYWQRSS